MCLAETGIRCAVWLLAAATNCPRTRHVCLLCPKSREHGDMFAGRDRNGCQLISCLHHQKNKTHIRCAIFNSTSNTIMSWVDAVYCKTIFTRCSATLSLANLFWRNLQNRSPKVHVSQEVVAVTPYVTVFEMDFSYIFATETRNTSASVQTPGKSAIAGCSKSKSVQGHPMSDSKKHVFLKEKRCLAAYTNWKGLITFIVDRARSHAPCQPWHHYLANIKPGPNTTISLHHFSTVSKTQPGSEHALGIIIIAMYVRCVDLFSLNSKRKMESKWVFVKVSKNEVRD